MNVSTYFRVSTPRFGSIPDLLELDHLTVSGDVTFGRGVRFELCMLLIFCSCSSPISFGSSLTLAQVSLRGTVIIIANHGERIDIPTGAVLENKTVSGNLRIMDH